VTGGNSHGHPFRFLTRRGLVAVERLMGMVLVALSVQMFLDSVSNFLE
jgi:multiple antibiotic resistance protein